MVRKKQRARERAWSQRTKARTWLPAPDYYLTERDLYCVEGFTFMRRLYTTTRRAPLRKACLHDMGRYLLRLRRHRSREEFGAILGRELSLSLRRGYEIMAFTRKNIAEKSRPQIGKDQSNQRPPKPRKRRTSKAKAQ